MTVAIYDPISHIKRGRATKAEVEQRREASRRARQPVWRRAVSRQEVYDPRQGVRTVGGAS
jgi:hypothetical protein